MKRLLPLFALPLLAAISCKPQQLTDAADKPVPSVAVQDTTAPKVDRSLPLDVLGEPEQKAEKARLDAVTEVDLGTIAYGDSVRHTFTYTNVSAVDFVIEQYTVGCGCTEISKPETILKPGETGRITLQFNSKEKEGPGDYKSDAMLIGNLPEGFIEFTMKIKVVAASE